MLYTWTLWNIPMRKVVQLAWCAYIFWETVGRTTFQRQMNRSVSRDMNRGDSNHALNADYVNAPRAQCWAGLAVRVFILSWHRAGTLNIHKEQTEGPAPTRPRGWNSGRHVWTGTPSLRRTTRVWGFRVRILRYKLRKMWVNLLDESLEVVSQPSRAVCAPCTSLERQVCCAGGGGGRRAAGESDLPPRAWATTLSHYILYAHYYSCLFTPLSGHRYTTPQSPPITMITRQIGRTLTIYGPFITA